MPWYQKSTHFECWWHQILRYLYSDLICTRRPMLQKANIWLELFNISSSKWAYNTILTVNSVLSEQKHSYLDEEWYSNSIMAFCTEPPLQLLCFVLWLWFNTNILCQTENKYFWHWNTKHNNQLFSKSSQISTDQNKSKCYRNPLKCNSSNQTTSVTLVKDISMQMLMLSKIRWLVNSYQRQRKNIIILQHFCVTIRCPW